MIPSPLESLDLLYLAKERPAKTGSSWLAAIDRENIPAMADAFLAAKYHLEDVSGLDSAEGAVVAYHFDHFDAPGRITVLAVAPHDAPRFPSIASVYHGAEWHERETRDFFGIVFDGNPNFLPLLLPEDMPDVHPLKKEEGARAPLHVLFAAAERENEVLKKADGFTLLDAPEPEPEPEPEAVPAPTAAVAAAVAAEKPAPAPAPEKAAPTKAAPKKAPSTGKPAAKGGKK